MNENDLRRETLYSEWSKGQNIPWDAWHIICFQREITKRVGNISRIAGVILAIAASHYLNYYFGIGTIIAAFIFSSIYSSRATKQIEMETGLSALDQWELLKINPTQRKTL